MVKHTESVRRQITDELFKCDHFVKLALKGILTQFNVMLHFYIPGIY